MYKIQVFIKFEIIRGDWFIRKQIEYDNGMSQNIFVISKNTKNKIYLYKLF